MNSAREEALFALALEKPVEKREAFLDAMCEDDPALRRRLEALLAAHEQPDTALADSTCGMPKPAAGSDAWARMTAKSMH